jgi:hypothetical protein
MVHKNARSVNDSFRGTKRGRQEYRAGVAGRLHARRQGVRGVFADHGRPLPNYPFRDQSARDVGVGFGEAFDDGLRRGVEEERRAIDGIREGAAELEFTARDGGPGMAEMRAAERGPFVEHVGDVGIEEEKVHDA